MGEEQELVAQIRAGAYDHAATLALALYGSEIYGYLINYCGGESTAAEVFGQFGEDMWSGLPHFEFGCGVRTWLYVIARNAAARYHRAPWQRRHVGESALDQAIDRVRTQTAPWQRTEVKDRWRELRDALDPEDRSLLVLRIDRELPWQDCARVTLADETASEEALVREAARLRKRFQVLKEELRARAVAIGLVEEP